MTQSKTLYTVLNPVGRSTHTIKPAPLAPRLDALDGKTVYLVDVGFGGAYEFLEEMSGWFSRRMPSVKTEVIDRKSTRLNSSHLGISYAVFCLKKKRTTKRKR